jgi:hypothetical protein
MCATHAPCETCITDGYYYRLSDWCLDSMARSHCLDGRTCINCLSTYSKIISKSVC